MDTVVKRGYVETTDPQQSEFRKHVLDGLKQVKEGNTKDFNTVCDRLEQKYIDAT